MNLKTAVDGDRWHRRKWKNPHETDSDNHPSADRFFCSGEEEKKRFASQFGTFYEFSVSPPDGDLTI